MGHEISRKLGKVYGEVILIPAIDLIDGKVVRLKQGNYNQKIVFSESPVQVAQRWEAEGASLLHVVDLEGAKEGQPKNMKAIAEIIKKTRIPVQVGGGIRNYQTFKAYLEIGASRVVLGSAIYDNPQLLERLLEENPEQLMVSLDVTNDGHLVIHGWQNDTFLKASLVAKELKQKGVQNFIFTDVTQDGTLKGIRREVIASFVAESKVKPFVAGGITSLADIRTLKSMAHLVKGAILGKALYTGKIKYREALKIIQGE